MPKVAITYSSRDGEYFVSDSWEEPLSEYQTIVDMKASHYRNIMRNIDRWVKDQEFLEKFFIEAQTAGRIIREQ